jgi:hypothetical protein
MACVNAATNAPSVILPCLETRSYCVGPSCIVESDGRLCTSLTERSIAINAEWRGGEPREPFTLNLMPNQDRWRGVWPKAVASALKTRGLSEDQADDLGVRLAAGYNVDGVVRCGGCRPATRIS